MKKLIVAGLLVTVVGYACSTVGATSTNDAAICEKLLNAVEAADSSNEAEMAAIGLIAIVAGTNLDGNDDLKAKAEAFKAELVTTGDISDVEGAEAYGAALLVYCTSL